MEIDTFTDLLVWQKAMNLLVDVYGITAKYPRSEQFGLTFNQAVPLRANRGQRSIAARGLRPRLARAHAGDGRGSG